MTRTASHTDKDGFFALFFKFRISFSERLVGGKQPENGEQTRAHHVDLAAFGLNMREDRIIKWSLYYSYYS
jgi:hypothetical protein